MRLPAFFIVLTLLGAAAGADEKASSITFNTNFEGASLGKVEVVGPAEFRCHVAGQQDERGRNRQPTWYFFRLDEVLGRELKVTLTGFVGEYNGKPAVAMSAELLPVFSTDGETWTHFPSGDWNDTAKEMTLRFTPESRSIYIAHIPPYSHSRLIRFLEELRRSDFSAIEVIGKTALGRDLHLVTVTNPKLPDAKKRCVWLQARQHAWEAGTSFVMEGALRFITSDDPIARSLRDRIIFKFAPMGDPDGCALGKVRFNANGYDLNRHWDEVDLRNPTALQRMPEIWYAKKAILSWHATGRPIDLLVNMHNTETAEYLSSLADEERAAQRLQRLFNGLKEKTSFDPSIAQVAPGNVRGTTNDLWLEARVPVVLMEQRIGPAKKLGRRPTIEDRLEFGRALTLEMAAAVLSERF